MRPLAALLAFALVTLEACSNGTSLPRDGAGLTAATATRTIAKHDPPATPPPPGSGAATCSALLLQIASSMDADQSTLQTIGATADPATLRGLAATAQANAATLRGLAAGGSCACPSTLQGLAASEDSNATSLAAAAGAAQPPNGQATPATLQALAATLRGLAATLQGLAATLRGLAASGTCTCPGTLQGLAAGTVCSTANGAKLHPVGKADKHDGPKNCSPSGAQSAQCDSRKGTLSSAGSGILDPSAVAGLHPSDLSAAYAIPQRSAASQTVAIVDAYDDPNAEADMAVYRSTFSLPACTSSSGCFSVLGTDKHGKKLPSANAAWSTEISLDLDMVSAVCPTCKIMLVEANSDNIDDIAAAVDTAAAAGANVISNSYYLSESILKASDVARLTPHYDHPGIPMTAAAGDASYGATFPASLPTMIAVGGTSLLPAQNDRGWIETAWHGSGAGCSGFEPKPTWQTDALCTHRTINDVSVVADPDTGVSVYDSYTGAGWTVQGGTSIGAPIVAALVALAANAPRLNGAQSLYANSASFFPISAGLDGTCGTYLCGATGGYSGPTGVGSPNGLGGF